MNNDHGGMWEKVILNEGTTWYLLEGTEEMTNKSFTYYYLPVHCRKRGEREHLKEQGVEALDKIKMDLEEKVYGCGLNSTGSGYDIWQDFVKAIMNLRICIKVRNLSTN